MKIYFIALLTIVFSYGCANNNRQSITIPDTNKKKADSFFPVTSFIKGQIVSLDSLPVTPLQITTIKEIKDSIWLSKEKLKPLLAPFLTPLIDETSLTKYFKQTVFNDQTLNAVTFTYDPVILIPDSIAIRHWDVYVDPETGNVSKVYIVKEIKELNQSYTQQLTWQTNKGAKITTILNKRDGKMELLKEVVFSWDF